MRRPFIVLSLAVGLSGCAANLPTHPTLTPLIETIEARLDLAQAVALHKWDTHQPVQASDRESQILARVRQVAPRHGLNAERAADFFVDQMEAGKSIQYHLLSTWQARQQAPDTPRQDLQHELRPQLDVLQERLLQTLARFDQAPPADCPHRLAQVIEARASEPLRRIALSRAAGRLCPPDA